MAGLGPKPGARGPLDSEPGTGMKEIMSHITKHQMSRAWIITINLVSLIGSISPVR